MLSFNVDILSLEYTYTENTARHIKTIQNEKDIITKMRVMRNNDLVILSCTIVQWKRTLTYCNILNEIGWGDACNQKKEMI